MHKKRQEETFFFPIGNKKINFILSSNKLKLNIFNNFIFFLTYSNKSLKILTLHFKFNLIFSLNKDHFFRRFILNKTKTWIIVCIKNLTNPPKNSMPLGDIYFRQCWGPFPTIYFDMGRPYILIFYHE